MPKAALYIRVSTDRQDPRNQVGPLKALAKARGWEISKVYRDVEKGGNPRRIALNQLMHDARLGKFQVIAFWAWDRVTRGGAKAALELMERWKGWGLVWESLQEPFLSSAADPHTAELLLSIVAWSAKEESRRISERTRAVLARRRALGVRIGRPKGAKDKRRRVRRWRRKPTLLS